MKQENELIIQNDSESPSPPSPEESAYGYGFSANTSQPQYRPASATILDADEENVICNWVGYQSMNGFQVNKWQIIDSVQIHLDSLNVKTLFKTNRPGTRWYAQFMKRHPEIAELVQLNPVNQPQTRDVQIINKWFTSTKTFFEQSNQSHIIDDPDRVFAFEECCMFLHPKENESVLFRRHEAGLTVHSFGHTNRHECLTVLFGGCASGKAVPPLLVYNCKKISPAIWQSAPNAWGLGINDTGRMTARTFLEYITNVFHPWLVANDVKLPVMLFVDGSCPYITVTLTQFCLLHGIELIAILPEAVDVIHPIGEAVYNALKTGWKLNRDLWTTDNPKTLFKRQHFAPLLNDVLSGLDMKNLMKSAFRSAGLSPFDGGHLIDRISSQVIGGGDLPIEKPLSIEIQSVATGQPLADIGNSDGIILSTVTDTSTMTSAMQTQEPLVIANPDPLHRITEVRTITPITFDELNHCKTSAEYCLRQIKQFLPLDVLRQFISTGGGVWGGAVQHTSLFNLWRKCMNICKHPFEFDRIHLSVVVGDVAQNNNANEFVDAQDIANSIRSSIRDPIRSPIRSLIRSPVINPIGSTENDGVVKVVKVVNVQVHQSMEGDVSQMADPVAQQNTAETSVSDVVPSLISSGNTEKLIAIYESPSKEVQVIETGAQSKRKEQLVSTNPETQKQQEVEVPKETESCQKLDVLQTSKNQEEQEKQVNEPGTEKLSDLEKEPEEHNEPEEQKEPELQKEPDVQNHLEVHTEVDAQKEVKTTTDSENSSPKTGKQDISVPAQTSKIIEPDIPEEVPVINTSELNATNDPGSSISLESVVESKRSDIAQQPQPTQGSSTISESSNHECFVRLSSLNLEKLSPQNQETLRRAKLTVNTNVFESKQRLEDPIKPKIPNRKVRSSVRRGAADKIYFKIKPGGKNKPNLRRETIAAISIGTPTTPISIETEHCNTVNSRKRKGSKMLQAVGSQSPKKKRRNTSALPDLTKENDPITPNVSNENSAKVPSTSKTTKSTTFQSNKKNISKKTLQVNHQNIPQPTAEKAKKGRARKTLPLLKQETKSPETSQKADSAASQSAKTSRKRKLTEVSDESDDDTWKDNLQMGDFVLVHENRRYVPGRINIVEAGTVRIEKMVMVGRCQWKFDEVASETSVLNTDITMQVKNFISNRRKIFTFWGIEKYLNKVYGNHEITRPAIF